LKTIMLPMQSNIQIGFDEVNTPER